MTNGMRSDLIDVALVIHHETKPGRPGEGAILVSDDGDREKVVWLPKSAVEIVRTIGSRREAIVTMPERLAIDKGLV